MSRIKFNAVLKIFFVMAVLLVGITFNKNYAEAAESYITDEEGQEVDVIVPRKINSGNKDDLDIYSEYDIYVSTEDKKIIVPIEISSRGLLYFKGVDDNNSTDKLIMGIYSDREGKERIAYSSAKNAKFLKKGTYYLIIETFSSTPSVDGLVHIDFTCNFVNGADTKLKNKQWIYSGFVDSKIATDYEIKITKPGTIKVEVESDENYHSYKVSLYSKDKKVLTEESSVSQEGDFRTFAVKKGTYYIRVTTYSDLVRVRYTEKAITETSGSSKEKASTLKLGKAQNGLVLSEDKTNKVDWFKFTLTKPTKIDINFNYNVSSGKVKYELTSSAIRGNVIGSLYSYYGKTEKKEVQLKTWTTETIPKGTYYIKVMKDNKVTNGNYSVKVVKR